MVQFRPQAREIIAKVVYYGPPLGGKTTNLRTLYQGYPPATRGELVVVPTGGDRTIFCDFLPIYAGELRGMQLRVQLYTVPGQVHYNSTRQVVLRGVDGVVFVADSQREMLRANRESWENLKENLLLQGVSLADLPHVLQYNKRDLADILSLGDLDQVLNEFNAPFYEVIATTGIGVEETLQGVVKLVARSLRDRFKVPVEAPVTQPQRLAELRAQPAVAPPPEPPRSVKPPEVPSEPPTQSSLLSAPPLEPAGPFPVQSVAIAPPPDVQPSPLILEHEARVFSFAAPAQPVPDRAQLGAAEVFAAEPLPPAAGVAPVPGAVVPSPPPVLAETPVAEQVITHKVDVAAVREVEAPAPPPPGPAPTFAEAAPLAEPPPALADPFQFGESFVPDAVPAAIPTGGEDVFAPPSAPEVVTAAVSPSLETWPGGETVAPGEAPVPAALTQPERAVGLAVQRVVPRALAQYGEVRELELEVPVPSVWVGGKRMTLQLRLTLVPQEEEEGG